MLQIKTPTGFKNFSGIKRQTKQVFEIKTKSSSIKATNNHKLLTPEGFKTVSELKIGDKLYYKDTIEKVLEIIPGKEEYVYDILDVETHQYYTNGFISHNCAFVGDWESFSKSVIPTISASQKSQVIALSTPIGLNHFHKMWTDAVEGKSSYKPFKVEWWQVPGRDENYKETMIKTLPGGIRDWNQEYACEFIGSSDTLIDMAKLSEIKFKDPISEPYFSEDIRIYYPPEPDHKYIVTSDGAKGGVDAFAIHIIDVTKFPFIQVGAGQIKGNYLQVPPILNNILRAYNEAYYIPENNDAGGTSVADLLFQMYEYENIYREDNKKWLGVRTTVSNRSKNLSNMKMFVENSKIILNDKPTVDEMLTFINKNGKYQADNGCHDDLVMALSLLFVPLLDVNNIFDYEGFIETVKEESEEDDVYKYTSLGFFDDGSTPDYGYNPSDYEETYYFNKDNL